MDLHLVHYGAVPALRVQRAKSERNVRLLRKRLDAEPRNAGLWVHLGNELAARGRLDEAEDAAIQAWSLLEPTGGDGLPGNATGAFTLLGRLRLGQDRFEELTVLVEQMRQLHRAGGVADLHPNVWFLEGVSCEQLAAREPQRKKRWQLLGRAAQAFQLLNAAHSGGWTTYVLPGALGVGAGLRLAGVLVQLGHFEAALRELDGERGAAARSDQAALVRAEALLGLGRLAGAAAALDGQESSDAIALRTCLAAHHCSPTAVAARGPWHAPHRARLAQRAQQGAVGGHDLVFIGGAGRSGTTLFRAMLHAHPRFHCPPELKILPQLLEALEGFALNLQAQLAEVGLTPPDLDAATGAFVASLARQMTPPGLRLAEKTPHNVLHMDALSRALPGARFIHLVRDGRAVVASLLMQPWVEPSTGEPVGYCQTARAAANYWAEVVQCARQDHAGLLGQVLEVRYEDLVQQPEATMRRVLHFLGEPWDDAVLDHVSGGARLPSGESSSEAVAERLHPRSVDRWRQALSQQQLHEIESEVGYLLHDLGYAPP